MAYPGQRQFDPRAIPHMLRHQQNEFKTRLIQPSLSRQRHRMHYNTPLIFIWQISVSVMIQYALKGCIWNATKYFKLKNASIWHINITFYGPSIPPQGGIPPWLRTPDIDTAWPLFPIPYCSGHFLALPTLYTPHSFCVPHPFHILYQLPLATPGTLNNPPPLTISHSFDPLYQIVNSI